MVSARVRFRIEVSTALILHMPRYEKKLGEKKDMQHSHTLLSLRVGITG